MITVKLTKETAESILQLLNKEQEVYTTDPTCVPERIAHIRQAIADISSKL